MRRLILVLAVVVVAAFAGMGRSQEGQNPSSEREIRGLEAQLDRAVVQGDRSFFERVLAPDFTHTSHSGKFKTRAQWMAESKFTKAGESPRPAKTTYTAFDVDELAVRVHGETAVVTGRSSPKGRNAQGAAIGGRYRFLRVWVKRGGQWRVVAFQGTRIAEP